MQIHFRIYLFYIFFLFYFLCALLLPCCLHVVNESLLLCWWFGFEKFSLSLTSLVSQIVSEMACEVLIG